MFRFLVTYFVDIHSIGQEIVEFDSMISEGQIVTFRLKGEFVSNYSTSRLVKMETIYID